MNKLELNHLSPYLPYGLKFHHFDDERSIASICEFSQVTSEEIVIINNMHEYAYEIGSHHVKPILRPLSDYFDITSPAMNELNLDISDQIWLANLGLGMYLPGELPYRLACRLAEEHIDFMGLIAAGLAVSYREAGL